MFEQIKANVLSPFHETKDLALTYTREPREVGRLQPPPIFTGTRNHEVGRKEKQPQNPGGGGLN